MKEINDMKDMFMQSDFNMAGLADLYLLANYKREEVHEY